MKTADSVQPVESVQRLVQVLNAAPEVRAYPEALSRKLWEGYDFPPLPLLG